MFQENAKVDAIGVHRHVDAGIDGQPYGVLLVLGHFLAGIQIVDVSPVSDNHAVPLQVLFQPLGQVFVAGMHGNAVDTARVNHDGECSGHDGSTERLEVFLTQQLWRQVGWRTVFARPWRSVCEVVFYAGGYMVFVQVVGVVALVAIDFGLGHTGIDDGILAETLPDARPSWVATQVDDRVVDPRAVSGPAFVGANLGASTCQLRVERCRQIDRLWKQRSALGVGDPMVMVQSVNVRNAYMLH